MDAPTPELEQGKLFDSGEVDEDLRLLLDASQVLMVNQDPAIVVYAARVNTGPWERLSPPINFNCSNIDPDACYRSGNYDHLIYAPRNQPNTTIWITYKKNNGPLKTASTEPVTINSPRWLAYIPPGHLGG